MISSVKSKVLIPYKMKLPAWWANTICVEWEDAKMHLTVAQQQPQTGI